MNDKIIDEVSKELGKSKKQVETVLTLLKDGSTVPFIARYRKEATGNLDEEEIRKISDVYEYSVNLAKRKEDVIRLIDEKGLLTDEIKTSIMACNKLLEVEDIYKPFKEKKKTKASIAIAMGLKPLAEYILTFPVNVSLENEASKYINDEVLTEKDAIEGALYIIAEEISDNIKYRTYIRSYTYNTGFITSKYKKNSSDEKKTYEMYYEFRDRVKTIKGYRVLALSRAESEKIVTVNIEVDEEFITNYLEKNVIKNNNSSVVSYVKDSIKDSYKRLIKPSVERSIRTELFDNASSGAIDVFSSNLRQLLLTPPMKDSTILGLDPAFRTGCKLAVIDRTGKVLDISVIYPNEPKNDIEGSNKKLLELINKYNVDIIAIGNGTASRESESLVANLITNNNLSTKYIIVSEAGASVYSASKVAIEEFPDLSVEQRSAISIARRLLDPLSELVKIEPKAIGVGQYQHDVNAKDLSNMLDFTVLSCVNSVGVNVNTASNYLLNYVSGISKKVSLSILDYRNEVGKITSRDEIKKIKYVSDKVYEQMIGFLRIIDGDNKLDETSVHPESYEAAKNILNYLEEDLNSIGTKRLVDKINNVNMEDLLSKGFADEYTCIDILDQLKEPLRDPRDTMDKPLLKSNILKLEDLTRGMKLEGTVRNIVDFGAFVDIGLKNDGMVHISKITDKFIKHPSEVLSVGDIIEVYVDEVNFEKGKVSLSKKEIF